jgi:epoxyqueuosine reductase
LVLEALKESLRREGLHVVLPLDRAGYQAAVSGTAAPALDVLLPGAQGAVLIGDGGGAFFARFRAAAAGKQASRHPLDDFTRVAVGRAVAQALAPRGVKAEVLFPFAHQRPALPFQRLGQAAGLPAPGPLGLQIHPRFGPWWAYRALVVMPLPLSPEPPLDRPCTGCPAPCVDACPVAAPTLARFEVPRCRARRLSDADLAPAGPCVLSCAARIACPVGLAERYPAEQLAFHMRASLVP